MMLRVWMIIWKEFIQIFRDWRTLTVVIILPVLMLILYGYAINFDLKNVSLGVMDQDRSRASRDTINAFVRNPYFEIAGYYHHPREVNDALDRGLVKAVLIIPRGFAGDLDAGRTGEVQILVDGADSTTASTAIGYSQGIIQEHSAEVTVRAVERKGIIDTENFLPVESRLRFWYNPEQRSANYIVPGLIAVIMMLMSSLLTSMTVVRERERGTIEQLIVSPLMPYELMMGKLLPYVIIAFLDVLLVIAAGRILFDVPLRGSPALLLGLSAIFLMAALGIGLFVSVVSPTQQTAFTFAMLASQLPTILLSGFIFPISAMPDVVQWLTNIIPAKHFLIIVRAIFLKGVGLSCLWVPTLVLLAFGIIILGLCSVRFKKKL
jgi:ABC-2 type transport system permease protein